MERKSKEFLFFYSLLDEAVTLTRSAHSHKRAVELATAAALESRFMQLIYSNESLFAKGMEIFKKYSDKEFSLTDCISFATMRKSEVKTSFTFDLRFKQFGFATIPKYSFSKKDPSGCKNRRQS